LKSNFWETIFLSPPLGVWLMFFLKNKKEKKDQHQQF
jgi:hypothetical protein